MSDSGSVPHSSRLIPNHSSHNVRSFDIVSSAELERQRLDLVEPNRGITGSSLSTDLVSRNTPSVIGPSTFHNSQAYLQTFRRTSSSAVPIISARQQPQPLLIPSGRTPCANHSFSAARSSSSSAHPYSTSIRSSQMSAPADPSRSPLSWQEVNANSSGMRASPRRRKPPAFPSSPRSIRSYRGVDTASRPYSPFENLQTPSILRVPPSPATETPTSPNASLPYYYSTHLLSSGTPISNVRQDRGSLPASRSKSRSSPGPASLPRQNPSTHMPQVPSHLEGIPQAYVLKVLYNVAPRFWNNRASSDVRVVIPIRAQGSSSPSPTHPATFAVIQNSLIADHESTTPRMPPMSSPSAQRTPKTSHTFSSQSQSQAQNPFTPGSRSMMSGNGEDQAPRIATFHLHRDYLVTHSTLFRSLISAHDATRSSSNAGTASTPSFPPTTQSMPSGSSSQPPPSTPSLDPGAKAGGMRIKGARVLPTMGNMPLTIWLPLPDPASFGALAQWMYWGNASAIENALARNQITWQGLVKNVEYLGLNNAIKRVLGSWWRRWVKVSARRTGSGSGDGRTGLKGGNRDGQPPGTGNAHKRNLSKMDVENEDGGTDEEEEGQSGNTRARVGGLAASRETSVDPPDREDPQQSAQGTGEERMDSEETEEVAGLMKSL